MPLSFSPALLSVAAQVMGDRMYHTARIYQASLVWAGMVAMGSVGVQIEARFVQMLERSTMRDV